MGLWAVEVYFTLRDYLFWDSTVSVIEGCPPSRLTVFGLVKVTHLRDYMFLGKRVLPTLEINCLWASEGCPP